MVTGREKFLDEEFVKRLRTVSQPILLADRFCLLKITTDTRILSHLNSIRMAGNQN